MNAGRLSASISSVSRRGSVAALATATIASLAGFATTPAAVSAPATPDCPLPADVARNDAVSVKTVTSGTDPVTFTGGRVLGRLRDGIAPGVDMIMVDFSDSPAVAGVDLEEVGIWYGMSGSPVYDVNGDLVGAVAYGLSKGPSAVAGVTPAQDMQKLLNDRPSPAMAAPKVEIPEKLRARLVEEGAATNRQIDSGFRQLKLPLSISGLSSERLPKLVRKLRKHHDLGRVYKMVGGSAPSFGQNYGAVKAGGNVAAAMSYGDVTAAGVGTATMVCGEEVVGFGHPMTWSGPATFSLHNADALYVQKDRAFGGFKVANLGSPIGTINEDRLAGIAGFQTHDPATPEVGADIPAPANITSTVDSDFHSERTGTTWVNDPEWMPELAFGHLLSNTDVVFDGIGEGSGAMSWSVDIKREDGSTATVGRSDVYADEDDITFGMVLEVYSMLASLEYNGVEDVELTDFHADVDLLRDYHHATVKSVDMRTAGQWVPVKKGTALRLRAGRDARFRVHLTEFSDTFTGGKRAVTRRVVLPVKNRDAFSRGVLRIRGKNTGWEGFFEGGEGGEAKTFDEIVKGIRKTPRNDQISAALSLYGESARGVTRMGTTRVQGVAVDGGIQVRVRVLP